MAGVKRPKSAIKHTSPSADDDGTQDQETYTRDSDDKDEPQEMPPLRNPKRTKKKKSDASKVRDAVTDDDIEDQDEDMVDNKHVETPDDDDADDDNKPTPAEVAIAVPHTVNSVAIASASPSVSSSSSSSAVPCDAIAMDEKKSSEIEACSQAMEAELLAEQNGQVAIFEPAHKITWTDPTERMLGRDPAYFKNIDPDSIVIEPTSYTSNTGSQVNTLSLRSRTNPKARFTFKGPLMRLMYPQIGNFGDLTEYGDNKDARYNTSLDDSKRAAHYSFNTTNASFFNDDDVNPLIDALLEFCREIIRRVSLKIAERNNSAIPDNDKYMNLAERQRMYEQAKRAVELRNMQIMSVKSNLRNGLRFCRSAQDEEQFWLETSEENKKLYNIPTPLPTEPTAEQLADEYLKSAHVTGTYKRTTTSGKPIYKMTLKTRVMRNMSKMEDEQYVKSIRENQPFRRWPLRATEQYKKIVTRMWEKRKVHNELTIMRPDKIPMTVFDREVTTWPSDGVFAWPEIQPSIFMETPAGGSGGGSTWGLTLNFVSLTIFKLEQSIARMSMFRGNVIVPEIEQPDDIMGKLLSLKNERNQLMITYDHPVDQEPTIEEVQD